MKEKLLRLSAMLLLLWYCFSVIGFNVHTCRASGRSFITAYVSGFSCSDIHPEHSCGHDEISLENRECCDDDHLALKLTGCVSEKTNSFDQVQQIAVLQQTDVHDSVHRALAHRAFGHLLPVRGLTVPWDYQSCLGIWRI